MRLALTAVAGLARIARIATGAALLGSLGTLGGAPAAQADTQLIGPVSEEAPGVMECPAGHAIRGISCLGWYCDSKLLLCHDISDNYSRRVTPADRISEETPDNEYTTTGFLSGLGCSGWYCDTLSFIELHTEVRPRERHCTWTDWFSEETTGFGENVRLCQDGYLVAGIRCHGDYCDSLKLQCCAE